MTYVFKTDDHPARVGRVPEIGEKEYTLLFHTDEDVRLVLRLGQERFKLVAAMLIAMLESETDAMREEVDEMALQFLENDDADV